MIANRSVPTDIVLPHIRYQDVSDAAAWLGRVFGFAEHYRYTGEDGKVSGVQMSLGNAWIMLEGAKGGLSPARLGYGTQMLTVFVDDVDAHFERAPAGGCEDCGRPA